MKSDTIEQELEVTLQKVVYRDDQSGWCVINLFQEDTHQSITATGTFYVIQPGERLRIRGKWVSRKEFGRQFQVVSYVSLTPQTLTGIQQYLASGLIRGIGDEMSKRLVSTFGLQLFDIIENSPGRLMDVDGIGKLRAGKIRDAWKEHKEIKDVMIFLQSHGISAPYAIRIFRAYGKDAMGVIHGNPYRLCFDIFGIGFRTADKIASHLGVEPESPQRAKAGLLYVLDQLSEKGHMCYPRTALVSEAQEVLSVPKTTIQDAIEMLRLEGQVIVEDKGGERLVYLAALHAAEEGVANHLQLLIKQAPEAIPLDIAKAIRWFESRSDIRLVPEQRNAIAGAITNKALVITGGPGTGKTTLIKGIIEICEKKGLRVDLCAPTGRAAKRMSEATGRDAKTIHRLFEFRPHMRMDEDTDERQLETDMLIIDEASMMDTILFYHVLKGLAPLAKLILVGDADQLPSVGPGNVLNDIISAGLIKTVRLDKIFRQARKSLIVINAHRINKGLMPYQKSPHTQQDYYFIHRPEPEGVLEVAKELVAHRIPNRFGLDPMKDIQVISPMHRGILGVSNLNRELQSLLNPSTKSITRGPQRLCEGDRVMQIRNNYELGVFNGDMGRIVYLDPSDRVVDVDFEDRIVRFENADIDELTLAYACSIHKSQGNEYPAVVIVLHTQHYIMLQRNLLYTAVTRGKSLVALIGNTKAVAIATSNMTKSQRYTCLTERLWEMA